MSHHLDYIDDPRLDIADVWCFRGVTGTVFVIDVAPGEASGFHPEGVYEFKIDTDGDAVEDITLRAMLPLDDSGQQELRLEMLTGAAARDRDAEGWVLTPLDSRPGQIVSCSDGITLFAGERGEPFFNDPRLLLEIRSAMQAGTAPDLAAYDPATADNAFGDSNVSAIVVEVPAMITGIRTIGFWGTSVLPTDAGGWRQLQHAAHPAVNYIWTFDDDFNGSHPKDQNAIFGAQVARETAAVVKALGTYDDGPLGGATPEEYGAYVRDALLPDVLWYDVGTPARYGPRVQNGKGLTDRVMESVFELVLNTRVDMGLGPRDATGTLLDRFPYLSRPVPM